MTERDLTKAKLGISSTARDAYIEQIIDGIKAEWENVQGMRGLDYSRPDVVDLLADYAAFRYRTHDPQPMPRHLQFRLRNLWIKYAGVIKSDGD